MTGIEKLRAAIQSGFDLLDVRSLSIEKMAAVSRKGADVCKEREVSAKAAVSGAESQARYEAGLVHQSKQEGR